METSLIGIAFVATAALFGGAAHANCSFSGPGSSKHLSLPSQRLHFAEHEGIVGTWLVDYGSAVGQALIQWHSDGTEWENITHPPGGGNICMGSWKPTGPWTYSRNHFGWLFDPATGALVGSFNETETDMLSRDGNSYSGTNLTIFYNLEGVPMSVPGPPSPVPPGGYGAGYPGTASATRIAP